MKRFFLMSTLLLAAMLVCAQTKIAPNMKKGMKKVYVTEATIGAPSNPSTTITAETVYEVVDATPDGYILDVYVTDVKTNAKDAESRIYSLATEMLKDVHTKYLTDKDGKVTQILNAEEGKKHISEMLDNVLAEVPQLDKAKADEIKKQLTGEVNDKSLLESMHISTSPLTLNGKTISTGTEEEYNTEQGIKMKRTYTVVDKSKIQSSATINMNADDMKKMVSGLVEKLLPNQSGNLMDMFGSLIGNLKIDASESADYTFQKDGWIKSITSEMSYSVMGTSFKMNQKVSLK
ncbi:MAG: hypothetical protein IJK51_00930 [Bacteroidaceae bacterium]|nr:hypothetical protein [Bacteroidaceae bacterium]